MTATGEQGTVTAAEGIDELAGLFHESAAQHPDRVAIEHGQESLTYRELASRSAAVASELVRRGVAPGQRVALYAVRHLQTYAAYLGILQAGCVVVPIAPATPAFRAAAVMASAEVRLALAVSPRPEWAGSGTPCADLLDRPASAEAVMPVRAGAGEPGEAYLLFTSGSTGQPKGVPITHRNALAYVRHAVARHRVTPDSRLSHTFELTFDPSVFDLFCAWGAGAALVVPQGRELLLPARYVNRHRITHWFSVPSVVSLAQRVGAIPAGSMPGLLHSQFIGEQLTLTQARAWREAAPDSVIDNVYGPTEVTVACAGYRLPQDAREWPESSNGTVPIGEVHPALERLVLDEDGRPAEDGELCLRGVQRFDGYLDPADNTGRFLHFTAGIATPFTGGVPTREHWYRTGDRVRVEDGRLVHLGRLDRQVKLSGYRIELGEIEDALRRHPAVLEAVAVVVDREGSPCLAAVLTGTEQPQPDLAKHLRTLLPEYMVPTACLWLSALPLGGNGKLDHAGIRRAAAEAVSAGRDASPAR
ncbi:amino acid adenylation domain-containing protein [Streptomyces sp. NPDC058646]|uniref:amino acid adenylation domain-containing protein n=1 Tax=Streptomyces sp. NPDC058646 TaxID=3346574 RepID=UPI0036568BC4